MKLVILKNKKGIKGIFAGNNVSNTLELISPIYEFKPAYLENPTRTSIQFKDKHFEDDIGQYINHNCSPNTVVTTLNSTGPIVLVPIKDISKDEEITIDYNDTEDKLSHPFKCDCHGKLIKGRN